MNELQKNCFEIGYSAYKSGASCIPSMNSELVNKMEPYPNCHETRMMMLKAFVAGVDKAADEKLAEILASE